MVRDFNWNFYLVLRSKKIVVIPLRGVAGQACIILCQIIPQKALETFPVRSIFIAIIKNVTIMPELNIS